MNEFKNKEIILIGLEQDMILELLKSKHKILGYFGNKKKNNSIKFLGSIGKIKYFLKKNKNVKICISMGPLEIRKKLIKKFKNNILTYISDEAIVSKNAVIGVGSFIQSFCFIGNNTKIGKCCKINVRSNIHHDTKIGSFTDLAPSVTILGNVRIGNDCYIGAGTIVREKIKIGKDIMTGIQSAVIKNLSHKGTYIGIPAQKIRNIYKRP